MRISKNPLLNKIIISTTQIPKTKKEEKAARLKKTPKLFFSLSLCSSDNEELTEMQCLLPREERPIHILRHDQATEIYKADS